MDLATPAIPAQALAQLAHDVEQRRGRRLALAEEPEQGDEGEDRRVCMGFDDRKVDTVRRPIGVGHTAPPQPLDATRLEVDEVRGMVDDAHEVGFAKADTQGRRAHALARLEPRLGR